MAAYKYIHPADENIVVEIYGTTWKLWKRYVFYVTGKAGFYNISHTTAE